MTIRYVAAVRQLAWLVRAVEAWFDACSAGKCVRTNDLVSLVPHRRATGDEATAVLLAMASLGILVHAGRDWWLDLEAYARSADYRRGVWDGFAATDTPAIEPLVTLLAAVPPSLRTGAGARIQSNTIDLRMAVFNLIASTQRRLVLISPYWDNETVGDLTPLLAGRISAGVTVDLLGRSYGGDASGVALATLAHSLTDTARRVFVWYRTTERDPFGSETFHCKVAVADEERAYVGTANFTLSGFRSRLEIGTLLTGAPAHSTASVVDTLLTSVATQVA